MFDFFKRKKRKPQAELTLENLTIGATFEYDMKTWVVREVYVYLWEDGLKTREYKASDGGSYFFLVVNNDGVVMVSKPVSLKTVAPDFKSGVLTDETVPEVIVYEGREYEFKKESFGSYQRVGTDNWSELTAWMYWDREEHFICFERWSKFEFEAHKGRKINPFEIDNLMPGEDE